MDRLEFKDQVVKLLNNCNSIPYLFIGSGLSFRYINTERWEELLKIFSDQVDISPTKFPYYKHQASSSINAEEELLYPKIATLIENDYNSYFLGTGKVEEKYLKDIEKISYFKLKIAEHFDNKFKFEYTEDQSLLEEIEMLKKLSISNIIGIITTNYDIFLEKLFEDFSVFIGQEELIFNPLVGMGNIYKIHGSTTKPDSIMITEKDYKKMKENFKYVIAKLTTIFVENPIIFLGYSISDEYIGNLIKELSIIMNDEQKSTFSKRLFFVEYTNDDEYSIIEKSIQGISLTSLTCKDFRALYEAIGEIKYKYPIKLLKHLEEDIAQIARKKNYNFKTLYVPIDLTEQIKSASDDIKFVANIGYQEKGYESINSYDIYEDILFDNKAFDTNKLLTKAFPNLTRYNKFMPIHKYLANTELSVKINETETEIIIVENSKNIIFKNNNMNRDRIETDTRKKRINSKKNNGNYYFTFQEVVHRYEGNVKKQLEEMSLLPINELINNLEEIRKFLKKNFNDENYKHSEFKKMIKIYDFFKFSKKENSDKQ